ncbi:MAG: S8 family serine peptidase [Candidatus Aminicenantes bacterium]|nr:S8 family serine peptidase [Candidatus Aminicenantes bacterium]
MKHYAKMIRWTILGMAFSGTLAMLAAGRSAANNLFPLSSVPPENEFDLYKHPKIDSSLCRLIHIFRTQGYAAMKQMADQLQIGFSGDLLRLTVVSEEAGVITTTNASASGLTPRIVSMGGKVETSYRNDIQALLPVDAIIHLATEAHVRRIRLPLKPRTCAIVSEGVYKTGADSWQNLAPFHNSQAVKVAILDLGFTDYERLLGTELPSSVTARSFRSDRRMDTNVHGTACAEIVHDMAPNAELYLVNFNTDTEQHQAVDWIISQGVNIISYSIGWANAGDGKGTGPITRDVERAAQAGITWCSAAGNDARVHWEGTFADPNSNQFHNFPDNDEFLEITLPPQQELWVSMNWDDWGAWNGINYSGSANDYDLLFYVKSGGSWSYLFSSDNAQNGAGSWPTEENGIYNDSATTRTIGLRILKYNAIRNCKMEIFAWGVSGPIEYNVPEGSLTIPADSPYGIALGASDVTSDAYHNYSSRGPTHDGRIKPDFAAPSGTSGWTYGSHGFYGTSSSTPHMAGAFALLKGKTPFSLSQVLDIITTRALDLGDPGQDNKFGKGRLKLK